MALSAKTISYGLPLARLDDGELLRHASLNVDLRIADLEEVRVVRILVAIRVDGGADLRARGEEGGESIHCCLLHFVNEALDELDLFRREPVSFVELLVCRSLVKVEDGNKAEFIFG